MNCKVIGLGGIGCCLLPILDRFLQYRFDGPGQVAVTLIDGDSYTEDNRSRQIFPDWGNKAEAWSHRLSQATLSVVYRAQPVYVTGDNVVGLIREGDVVLLGVDNHATRKLVSQRCEELDKVVLISGGNELTDGNVMVYIREDGQDRTLPLTSSFHPEIADPADRNPGELGCEELVASAPQLIITNNLVAALMLNAFWAHLERRVGYDEVYADAVTNNARQVTRQREPALV